jgi:hypothetical protein
MVVSRPPTQEFRKLYTLASWPGAVSGSGLSAGNKYLIGGYDCCCSRCCYSTRGVPTTCIYGVVVTYVFMLFHCGRAMWSGSSPGFCFFPSTHFGHPWPHHTAVKINLTLSATRARACDLCRVYSSVNVKCASSSFWKSTRCFPKVLPEIPTIWRSNALRCDGSRPPSTCTRCCSPLKTSRATSGTHLRSFTSLRNDFFLPCTHVQVYTHTGLRDRP